MTFQFKPSRPDDVERLYKLTHKSYLAFLLARPSQARRFAQQLIDGLDDVDGDADFEPVNEDGDHLDIREVGEEELDPLAIHRACERIRRIRRPARDHRQQLRLVYSAA